jgi:hypothetical protein
VSSSRDSSPEIFKRGPLKNSKSQIDSLQENRATPKESINQMISLQENHATPKESTNQMVSLPENQVVSVPKQPNQLEIGGKFGIYGDFFAKSSFSSGKFKFILFFIFKI